MTKTKTSFKPGVSGNKKGRPKGSVNKKTVFWSKMEEVLLNDGAEKFMGELNKLTGKDFVHYYLLTIEYFRPKLQRQEVQQETKTEIALTISRTVVGVEDAVIVEPKKIESESRS